MKYISFIFLSFLSFFSHSSVLTVQANEIRIGNCMPFGCPQRISTESRPHAGYIYRNIAPFTVKAGDILSFDTADVNDQIFNFDIAFMQIKENTVYVGLAETFTTVVNNGIGTGMGNNIVGDYDVSFVIDTDFTFAGGGLVIDLIPRGLSRTDNTFVGNLVGANADDSSDLFFGRYIKRQTYGGIYEVMSSSIANFRLTMQENTPDPEPQPPTGVSAPVNSLLFVFISIISLMYRKFLRN